MSEAKSMTWEDAVQTLRDDPKARELVEACFYDDPLTAAAERYHRGSEWRAIRAILPSPRGTALDIGAGRGIASYAFAKDGWKTSALEPDPSSIVGAGAIRALAQDAGLSIDVVEEWGERLPFEDAAFDVVHCRAVLHHAHDLQDLCTEVARVLKPGGIFIAAREHVVTSHADIPAFQASHPLHHLYGGEYAYTLAEYVGALTRAKLVMDEILNPFASDINLYPVTMAQVKRNWSRRLHLPVASLIPDAILKWRGARNQAPGRLYSFVCRKPAS